MVSPISIPGFPSVHTRQSAATCDAALESRLASLEACVTALPSLITAAIDQAFADSLTQFRRDMFFRGAGEGISNPLAGDHHGSPAIDPIQLTRRPICAEGAQSQLSPSAVQAPPQLSSSPLLQALATSAVKPHSKDSAAATVLLPESKTGIHASTMTSAPQLLHEHSFPDTTKTGSTVLLLFGVIACYTGHSAFVYHAFLNAKYGWVNWYFVGKFVKKDFYALELFEEMSKRLNTYNMSLSSNLDAWDIVEDVAIAYEYNNITMRNQIPKSEPASLKPLTLNEFTELIRLEIAMNGFTEVLTFILGSWHEIFPMSSYKDDKDVAKLKEIGESFIIEGNPESCTSWLSMSGEVLASGDKLMYLPCGLDAGSSIIVVGSSHYAYEEYVSQLAKLRWGDGTVMVSQFMDELLTHGGQPYDNIVVLVCRYLPKDLAASFTEENGTLGHINAIKQFLCLSLLHICAFTVMAISQLDYSIFTSLLSKLNQELCHRVDVHLDAVSFPNCVENDQIFQQPGWCHKLNDPCDNISYQRVFFNKRNNTKWLMEKPCILSFTVVEEKGKRKAFGFVTSIIRLLEESANLKGLKGGHVGQEQDMFAILNCKHINDLLKIKAELFPCNFQKLLPIVLCLPLVIEHDNAWKIAILFCDAALDTIILQFLLELLSVGKASVGIVIREGTTNENVFDIRTWAILFEDHCFMVEEMLYLTEMDQHFPDDTYLSDALPLNPRKSLIAQTSYFKKVIFMVTNNLTSSPNLEIEVKLLFQENETTTSSILLFLFHGMHSKECGKSGKKEALQFVAEIAQQCGTVNAVRQYLWLFEEFPPKVVHAYVDSFNFRGRGFDEAWFIRFAGKFKEKYKIDVFQNATACLHLCTACEMLKKVLSANHEAPLNTECLMEGKVFSRMKLTSILGLFHDNSLYYEMTDESLMSYKGKSNENEYLINHIDSSKHIDFSSGGVTSALRITDGALAMVDGIEEASTCRSADLQSSIATIETIMNNLYDDLTAVILLLLKNADARENVLKYLAKVINKYSSWAHIQVDPLPCDISRSEYQWHVPSHQNAWKQITKEGSYNGQFQGQFHFVFSVASRTSIFNTKAEIALKENFATAATLLVVARFKQVSTVIFLSLEEKANFQGGNIVMNPICD